MIPKDDPAPYTVLGSRQVNVNKYVVCRVDQVRLPNGLELPDYAYVEHPGASLIVPVTTEGEVVLIRQYRHPTRQTLWEVPAGLLENETPEENARKELGEEIGGTAGSIEYVGSFFSAPGHSSARMYVFLARDVVLGERRLEETEDISMVRVSPAEALRMARAGEIMNGPSALALFLCESRLLSEIR